MDRINNLLSHFDNIAASPGAALKAYNDAGKKIIGCFPYYVPEELVTAAGMVPFGIWGAEGSINEAKEYFPPFYCTIAQMSLQMGLTGKLDGLSGVILSSMCDTLRPLTQNFRVAVPHIPFIFLAHPQNRRIAAGLEYTKTIYTDVKRKLEDIAGRTVTDNDLQEAIAVHNESRRQRRLFVRYAGQHSDLISPMERCAVLKSYYFMEKAEYNKMIGELNGLLRELPAFSGEVIKVMTSGIIADSPSLLQIFADNNIAIVADDVAQESRSFRLDVPNMDDPMDALVQHFSMQDHDTLLHDPEISKRPGHVVELAKQSGAQGVIILMMQFCDPEEIEYPSLKKELEKADLPHIVIGVDQQIRDFGQARTSVQAFADMLGI